MTLPGGPAAKFGNRYEKLWTLSELVRMLRGETDSMRLEVPGLDGAEFVVQNGAQKEFHQAKRSHPSGSWSMATLASAGVLPSIGNLLRDNDHRFVFASGSDSRELADLCEAAADAESIGEFEDEFLAAETRAVPHKRLLREWNLDELSVWKMLRRVAVHTIDDNELEMKVKWGLTALFIDAAGAQDRLSTIVDERVHRTIERDELVQALRDAGFPLRQIRGDARQAVAHATDRYLAGVRRSLINGAQIPRSEATAIVTQLTGDRPSDCILTGGTGMGKTACIAEIAEGLRQAKMHVLVFRLDRHMAATTTRDLGERLGLEESPTVTLSAAANADGKPAVLIIDQLDAVSAMSGRDSGAFDVVGGLLDEAKPYAIRTLVVCRSFDWQHDPQLRRLASDEGRRTDLGKLTPDAVRAVLSAAHAPGAALGGGQLELLRVPQNLSLLLDSGVGKSGTSSFKTRKDLFDSYWDHKRERVRQRAQDDHWIDVVRTVCTEMTETQQLSVRKEKLDKFPPAYLDQCVSENVLTADRGAYGFGHESFFDYCFARLFAGRDESLASVLKTSEQHLFRRAQVRQVLEYLRDADFQRYVNEVQKLVEDDDVRAHIKDLVFALLAEFDDPRDEEWDLWMHWVRPVWDAMEQDFDGGVGLANRGWERLYWARSWFTYFDERGVIKGWLGGGTRKADVAVRYLSRQQRYWPDRVAALLEPYADRGGLWPARLRAAVEPPHVHVSRRLFDLFLRLVDVGTFDGQGGQLLGGFRVGSMWRNLANHRPEWVPEFLAHHLRRCVARSKGCSDEAMWRGFWRSGSESEALTISSRHSPRVFVDYVLPAVLEASEAASYAGATPPVRDAIWPSLAKSDVPTLGDACLQTLVDALGALAGQGEDMAPEIANLSSRRTYVANHLLLALYRGDATRHADEAILEFCDQPWRFDCGHSDSPYWSATETITATVRHCGPTRQALLEKTILAYLSPYERTKEGVRHRGYASFNLLAAIPDELRSAEAKSRFAELERKFRQPAPARRGTVGAVFVGPPIPRDANDKMTDDQWLNAIATHRSVVGRRPLEGGAVQQAREFGRCAAKDPSRFANIGLQLPRTTNPVYLSELLRGLADKTVADAIKVKVCRRVLEYAADECGGEVADLLATASDALPDEAVQMLVSLAIGRRDANEEAWQDTASGQPPYDGDVYTNGLNTTRGRAALAMGELIGRDASYIQRFGAALDQLAGEQRPSVASCVAAALRIVASHDAERGLSLFQRMDFREERLLATHHVYEFMRENMWHGFDKLKDVIVRTLRSAHPDVRQSGARLACMAARHHAAAINLATEARQGDAHQRRGVAEVASANVGDGAHKEWCEDALKRLFTDSDAEVRKVAASCFRHVPEDDLDAYGDLIETFCASPAFEQDPYLLLDALQNAPSRLPGTVCLACESFLDRGKRLRADGFDVVDLVFRLYQHHQNDEWTRRALDLIDRACLELDGAAKGFEDFER